MRFYRSLDGREPVRDWLRDMPEGDRKAIGNEIRTVQFAWPVGMPLVRKLAPGLWEVRVSLRSWIARVLFTIIGDEAILLHGFIKQSRRTPGSELDTALKRRRLLLEREGAWTCGTQKQEPARRQ